jgi:hypothetical protein
VSQLEEHEDEQRENECDFLGTVFFMCRIKGAMGDENVVNDRNLKYTTIQQIASCHPNL